MRRLLTALVATVVVALPLLAQAADKQIGDVKELAGNWQGWVNFGSQERATMIVKDDGSYEASTRAGTLTRGAFYLDQGTLRYRSSRTSGTATLSESNGKTWLRIAPESVTYETGPTEYERVR